ncbi:dihydrolipoamide acetyltransferase family protein [Microbacterium terricola]|uniref:Dihydrolipoamide acetyltransferase component of pyruvate dehydrogenase complex n=1 Tax=Microbacterium terricola TaxID=344163 RepID=A0ABM8DY76_9MICO|nr:dihydrolipoamide acetyltransferase family protein [Microbacterium terricola]UYK38804.1 2-oxo acid dehydrogenase subunit E2 [Microbacterium terricola]BDV30501.1 dihydrolipoamide acetyltransferase component of pyruvate dehydrogenase complex [Microbacterium terricola]
MTEDFRLPDLGEGLPEAELVQWLVAAGDEVTLNQPIAEVETAKAVVELPSPYAGTVSALHAAPGDVVAVGAVLISFDLGAQEMSTAPGAAEGAETAERAEPNLVGYGAAPQSGARPHRRARAQGRHADAAGARDSAVLVAAPHDAIVQTPDPADRLLERPRSTPPVRAHARDLGIDLALVAAGGVTGRITRADVDAYAATIGRAPAGAGAAAAPGKPDAAATRSAGSDAARTTRIPIRGVRKHTAEAMVRSAFTAPHATTFHTVDVTATSELIASLMADRALAGHRIGIMAVAAKAVCLALRQHPSLNARWDADAGEIVEHHYVNLGIAAATERGLVVPNIADADALDLVELADAIGALTETARTGRTAPAAMSGGTFTITNVGVFGVDAGTPILNPGEAGILALGAVRRQPWEHRGEIALRDVMTLSLSFDHRLVDGEQAALLVRAVSDVLREPGRAMLLR